MKRPWLSPLVPLYSAGLLLRELKVRQGWAPLRRLQWPVISIGNLSSGGSGKTPLTIALAQLLRAKGLHVDVLSRGYGRTSQAPARVQPDGTAEQYGDEPLLIARQSGVPVFVAPQRYDAGLLAEADSSLGQPGIHILDDGFQHRQLARDLDLLLLNCADLRDHLLPAGNLREPLKGALRANVIAVPPSHEEVEVKLRSLGWQGPVWHLRRHMERLSIEGPVLAFCGIAKPDQLFSGLSAAGVCLTGCVAFGDHHRYRTPDVKKLVRSARATGAKALLTTEKDQVRLEGFAALFPPDLPLRTVGLSVEIEEESAALEWLIGRLLPSPARSCL